MTRFRFLNTKIDNLSMDEASDEVIKLSKNAKKSYVVTPNVSHIVMLEDDKEFQEVYDNASLILCDGKPLVWVSKIYKTPIKEKVSGADLFPEVCKKAAKEGLTVFLFGARKGVAQKAEKNLKRVFPDLKIAGTYSPDIGFERDEVKLKEAIEAINKCSPDILVLALGSPKQEKFIYNNRDKINFNVALCTGAALDFVAGEVRRAPKAISNMGFEWLYRFSKEPKRLFKRYFVEGPRIIPITIKYKEEAKEVRSSGEYK